MTASLPRTAPRALGALSDLHRGELVGLRASIERSCNQGIVGASGTVVGETKNMLVLSTGMRRGGKGEEDCGIRGAGCIGRGRGRGAQPGMRGPFRSYPKAGSVWRFWTGAGREAAPEGAEIDGSLIARRPEDRLRARLPAGRRHARRPRGGGGSP